MRTALITIAHGRHDHLRRQQQMIGLSRSPIDDRVLVAIGDPDLAEVAAVHPVGCHDATIVDVQADPAGLPLAAARNAGAVAALRRGAELLIFLDVDCLPDPAMVGSYRQAAHHAELAGSLLCGPVAYLPQPPVGGYDLHRLREHPPHPARPTPKPGSWQVDGDPRLFWSLSFAVTARTWERVGGFEESYLGYGAEDTDFAFTARRNEVGLTWVGDALAFHQWHPTVTPPTHHLDDILRNGALFAHRWGRWPMEGWLSGFASQGLIEWDETAQTWRRCAGGAAVSENRADPAVEPVRVA